MGNWTVNYISPNGTDDMSSEANIYQFDCQKKVIHSLIILICILGIIGNGIVIRILHFQIKRTPFIIYILNLVVADSGTLVFLFISAIWHITMDNSNLEIIECLVGTFCTGQFLLTIISIDRCLAVFFPIWHRCHQPPYLSTILCAVAWIVSFSVCAIHYTLILVKGSRNMRHFYHLFIYTIICVPLMVVSSLALFLKGYLKSRMKRRGKLLKAILLALLFFLIFSLPTTIIYLINLISNEKYFNLFQYGYLCACLNSSVNPLIYFLLGRKKEHHSMYNLNISLQRVFKEEEEEESDKQPKIQVDIHL
ncbi:proto-oncogene Mas-like [Thamnophis elegans]|uniref:proto-oncogene Mas-like n=1 Tax=Thamnophis elegans TaxID=35005 RepID=UPI001376F41E|nr:proto-oncogene Mas-like [Thamnophis elegans]